MSDTITTPATFATLQKGDRFRVWRGAGTGINTGVPAGWSQAVYTKVNGRACKDEDGQWLNVQPVQRVQREGGAP